MKNSHASSLCIVLVAILSVWLAGPATALADSESDRAVEAAKRLNLSQSQDWLLLMHDYPDLFSGAAGNAYHSMLDDPNYFLSPEGKSNAESELEATIRAMYRPQELNSSPATLPYAEIKDNTNLPPQPGDDHPQCRFPARFAWLKTVLSPEDFDAKPVRCPSFDEWFKNLDAKKLILVFPAAYLNSPASMFGHTLLRVESSEHGTEGTILGHGASFAAFTGDDGGIPFAFKGLFGGYIGAYSVSPYYKEIRRYSDLEHRDIWEYSLSMTSDQIDRVVRHLWELQTNYFDYYFFDENCALHLLGLLDYGDPELHLSEQLPLWVIPAEAVRAMVNSRHGNGKPLVDGVTFRPSRSTKIHALQAEMTDEEQFAAKAVALGETPADFESFVPERKAKILDLAIVYIEYLNTARKVPVEETKEREHKLLIDLSKLPSIQPPKINLPDTRPEQGHRPGRLSIGLGRRGDDGLIQYRFRPAHHQNIDPQPGYVAGAEVTFFDLAFEEVEGRGLVLDAFVPLKIVSLSPRERFIKPWSWEISTGIERRKGEERDPVVSFLSGGFGASVRPCPPALIYLLAEPAIEHDTEYRDNHRLAVGPKAGAFLDIADPIRLGLSAKTDFGITGEIEGRYSLDAELRYALTPGDHPTNSIRSTVRRFHELDSNSLEWTIQLDTYF